MDLIDWDNKNWKEKENGDFIFDLSSINSKIFDTTAQKWSLVIANSDKGVEKNQLRNFYDKVLELEEKSLNATKEEFDTKILPFIKMLNSKVVYAKNKHQGGVNEAFMIFMQEGLKQITTQETFLNFKYLFESVIGFYQKGDFIKNKIKNRNYNKGRR